MFEMFFTHLVIIGLHGIEVGIQRGFNINHDLTLIRHANNHVWTQATLIGVDMFLFEEITVLDHAGEFGKSFQGHFTPLPTHLRAAQGRNKITRFHL